MAGLTNRLLGRVVEAAFTAFPEAGRHFPRRQGPAARQPHPPPAARELHAPGRRARRAAPRCWSSAARRAPTASTCGSSRRCPTWPTCGTAPLRPPDRGRATASRWRRATRAVGFAPDVREFITDMSAAYAGRRPGGLPRRRHHARRADRLQEALDPGPLPGRRRQPPGGERPEPGGRRRRGDDRGARPDRRAAGRARSARILLDPELRERDGPGRRPAGRPQAASEIADVLHPADRAPLGHARRAATAAPASGPSALARPTGPTMTLFRSRQPPASTSSASAASA